MPGSEDDDAASQGQSQDPTQVLRNLGLPAEGSGGDGEGGGERGGGQLGDAASVAGLDALLNPEKGRSKQEPRGLFGAVAQPVTAQLSIATILRAFAWWSARPEAEAQAVNPLWPWTLSPAQITVYLEDCSFRDALEEENRAPSPQKPSDDRIYDGTRLHMLGIRDLMREEIAEHCQDAAERMREAVVMALGPTLTDAQKQKLAELRVG